MDINQSKELGLAAVQKIRTTHNDALNASTDAAVKVIKHFYAHADASLILKCRDALKEYGAKGASAAFLELVRKTCSITKDGAIKDEAKHKAFKLTYENTLDEVELAGLVDWHTGGKPKKVKTDAEKLEARRKAAMKYLEEVSENDTPEGNEALALLKMQKVYSKAADKDAATANAIVASAIGKLQGIYAGVANKLREVDAA